jgi:hypothetical protein
MNTMTTTSKATERLNAICDAQSFDIRYCVRNLLTGETFGRGADEETPSASTRKTSIMMAALKAVGEGRLDLNEQIVYEERFAEEVASGIFRYLTPGIVISLRDAITGMMVLSDNVCTKMVFERLTLEEVDLYCKSIGINGTHHRFLIPPLALAGSCARRGDYDNRKRSGPAPAGHSRCADVKRGRRQALLPLGALPIRPADVEKSGPALRHPFASSVRNEGGEQGRSRQARPHGRGHRLPRRRTLLHHRRLYRSGAAGDARRDAGLHDVARNHR